MVGELNARIGTKETFLCYNGIDRKSKDIFINAKRKKVIEPFPKDDAEGSFIFLGGQGKSVIDYLVRSEWFQKEVDMEFIT